MNTRGEQLEPHEIAKARIIGVLGDAQEEDEQELKDSNINTEEPKIKTIKSVCALMRRRFYG